MRSQELYQQGFFASLNVLGQILGCYLVCASSHGLTLIDQHAAHERIAFEKLRYQLASGKIEKQVLLVPQSVQLSPGEMLLLEQKLSLLENYGFELEPFGRVLRHNYCPRASRGRRRAVAAKWSRS
jgi:DNA mismatch repair protein MutL